MPREQVEWYTKQSLHDNDRRHSRQRCTYYSIINVDKTNYPYSSSFVQEQTWTLIRTMSNNNKRYQSSIENIHLTVPPILSVIKPISSKRKIDRSITFLPPLPPPSHRLNRVNMNSKVYQQQTLSTSYPNSKTNSVVEESRPIKNPMRIMQVNGQFVVRI